MKNFLWGAATASAQVEGGYDKDGKSLTIWDVASLNGRIVDGHSTFNACNCYNNEKEDIKFLSMLGANSYRFSLSWSRILPNGIGQVNQKGVDYYNRLIDGLLKNGIEPFVTLYHWDLPQCLQEKGGLLSNEFSLWFEYYAEVCARLFGDRVKYFTTFNEPECICYLGYGTGDHAPFIKGGSLHSLNAAHNLLLAHGRATRKFKEICGKDVKVGMVSACAPKLPANEQSIETARKAMFGGNGESLFNNVHFFDPIVFGEYPKEVMKNFPVKFTPSKEDMNIIHSGIDFVGLNLYQGEYVDTDEDGNILPVFCPPNTAKSVSGSNFTPECIYYACKYNYERYGLPVYITENGVSLVDAEALDGIVHDHPRIRYIHDHLISLKKAVDDGIDIRGYFHWTLYDNLEWCGGFTKKFGLIHNDFITFEKTPKKSFWFYKDQIEKYRKEGL